MQTQRNLYDGFVNDSDLICTHSRLQLAYNLTDQMAGDWTETTSPTLDLADFMGIQFTTGPDGKRTSCLINSSLTTIGSAKTGLTMGPTRTRSWPSMVMTWACL